MRREIFCTMFFLISYWSSAQLIVNVENSRIQSDTTGWKGDIGTLFSLTQNVQQILNIGASFHLQYKTPKDMYLLLGSYNLLRGSGTNLSNNMFYHLRYNRMLSKVLRWEAFTQWQQNSVTNIDLRALVGTGPRFRIHESKKLRLYAAALTMYEHEKDKAPREIHNDIRGDNYISATFKPNNVFDITTTTFYQPLYKQFKDYRILNQISFNVKATKHLMITTNWDYSYDEFPPAGTPNINYTITNGFSYTF